MHDDKSRLADAETIEAVRRVIRDWDGLNYEAVRQALVGADWPAAEVDRILATPGALRQAFAVGQRRIAVKLGGCPQTTDATITPLNLSAEDVSRWAQGGGAAAAPETTTPKAVSDAGQRNIATMTPETAADAAPGGSGGSTPAESASVVLNGMDDHPVVRGKQKSVLTAAQHAVIKAMLGAKAKGQPRLTMSELDRASKRTDARKILHDLSRNAESFTQLSSPARHRGRT
jgi:hypothetical protein